MSNEIGKSFRTAFLEMWEKMGTDCHVNGENRKALIEDDGEGITKFKFVDEFALAENDTIRNHITEERYKVTEWQAISRSNTFHHFEVLTFLDAADF